MLQTADLTIRLNANDDVVIARVDLPEGTDIIKEKVRTIVRVPAGHKIATRDVDAGRAGAPLQPDHRFCQPAHPAR